MNEDVLDYLFKWAQDTGYKKSREDFVKLIQSNDKVLNRAFEFAQSSKKPYKKDIDSFALLVGRTKPQSTQSEPVATEQPAKVEPTTTEPTKVEPTKVEPQATETVNAKVEEPVKEPIVENKPAIQVKEVEAKKEEVAKKEIPAEALNQNIIPITDKTEVKAVETPSDKMVVKSEKKEEEFECPPGEKGCLKNQDVVDNYVTNNYRKNNLNYAAITDSEGRLAEFIDSGGGYGKSMTDFYKDEDYEHNKKGFMYAAEELPKSKRFSVFDIKLFGKDKSVIYDNKTGVILESTDDVIKNKQGDTVKVWLDVPMTGDPSDPYGIIKEEIDAIKGIKKTEEKKPESKLEKYRNYNYKEQVKEQPKTDGKLQMEVKDVTKEESDRLKVKPLDEKVIEENKKSMEYPTPPSDTVFDVKKIKGKELYSSYDKENNKWYTYPVGSNKKEWTEVKSGQMKSALNAMFTSNKLPNKADAINLDDTIKKSKVTEINLDTFILDSKNKEIKADIPTFELPKPSKKYKPYGEKGPDVYYSEYYDQYVIKEGDKKILAEKGSDKYNELDSKIGKSAKATIEGTGKCDPDRSQEGCTKNGGFLNNFLSLNNDNYEIGFRTTTEGILINKLNEDKEQFEEEGESRYVKFSNKDLETQSKEYNMLAGQIWYANDEPPKDKRFVIYKPYGNDDTLIYDKESEVILKQVGKAPYVSSRDLSGENDVRQTYKKIQQENPNEGLNVWYGYHKDRPEYKELKSLIDGMDYKKEKGSKNTFIPLTTTPGMPEWSPIPNKK